VNVYSVGYTVKHFIELNSMNHLCVLYYRYVSVDSLMQRCAPSSGIWQAMQRCNRC